MRRPTSNGPRKPLTNLPQPNLTGTQPLTPLAYMLAVINDPTASAGRRDAMARAAARYMHPRPYPVGKKRQQAAAAKRAGIDDGWGDDLQFSSDGGRSQ